MTDKFIGRTEDFLDDFMKDMYPKKDHTIAREYFRELFKKLLPRYFCIYGEKEDKNQESIKKRLLKTAITEKHIFLLRKESRNLITY
jgi:hypothetical protein